MDTANVLKEMLIQQVMSTTSLFIHCQTEVNISNMLSFTTSEFFFYGFVIITFYVSRRRKMYCGHARLCLSVCVCLSVRGHIPTLLHGPGCNLGEW